MNKGLGESHIYQRVLREKNRKETEMRMIKDK